MFSFLISRISTHMVVVRDVSAESALEKAAAIIPMVKNISTGNPRCSVASSGRMLSDLSGRVMLYCDANTRSRMPKQRKR